jgi:hypothetical protein
MRRMPLALALVSTCALAACGGDGGPSDPGRVTLHRLNNAEYNNTVRDLLGTSLRPADDFPADDRGYGFDNVADVLRLSPLSLELYQTAAEALIADALATPIASSTQSFEIVGDRAVGNPNGTGWLFFSNGTASITAETPVAATYRIEVRAYGQQAGPDPARLSIEVPNRAPTVIDVTATAAAPAIYQLEVPLPAGNAQITVGFVNDYYDAATSADRNLWIDYVEVIGPLDGPVIDGTRRARILTCPALDERACQTAILDGFARRAWRRPVRPDELTALLELVDLARAEGDTAENGLRLALQQVLVSPHFLFRVELDPEPTSRTPHPLTDWELASRLSYFLWSSMPDDALFAAAAAGTLKDPAELRAQAERMLADPKAVALLDNFAGQWLFLRAVGDQDPDYQLFPDYDQALEEAMRAESRRFFQAFLDERIPMDQFLTADFTYVNDRLAQHYGLPAVGTDDLVKVSLADTPRRGFLMQASFLRVTSRPKRTSPVLRGKWILDNLLCTPPRPPPPGVEGLPDGSGATGSVRQRLEAHVTNPVCASCHRVMDPLGFGLDNFDAIGAYRTMDNGYPIDATGELGDGTPFTDGRSMVEALAANPAVYRCMVEKLFTYTGRSPYRIEAIEAIDELTHRFIDGGYILPDLILELVTSPSFTARRGEP